jgi:8-oxo-dGTP pyrophosphatase MutT (NUDIX family)
VSSLVTPITAGGLVVNKTNKFLFIYKNGMWDLPKGKREKNEKLPETALREVSEETGVDVDHLNIESHLINTPYYTKKKGVDVLRHAAWFFMRYDGDTNDLIPDSEEGIMKADWLSINCLMTSKFKIRPYVLKVAQQYFNHGYNSIL